MNLDPAAPTPANPYHAWFPNPPAYVLQPAAEGNYAAGIGLGFILGLWGLVGCVVLAKPSTKRGALHGFLARVGIAFVVVIIVAVLS